MKTVVTGNNKNKNKNNHNTNSILCKTFDFQIAGTQNQLTKTFTPSKFNIAAEKRWLRRLLYFRDCLFFKGYPPWN